MLDFLKSDCHFFRLSFPQSHGRSPRLMVSNSLAEGHHLKESTKKILESGNPCGDEITPVKPMYFWPLVVVTPSLEPLNDCQFLKVNPHQNKAEISKNSINTRVICLFNPSLPIYFRPFARIITTFTTGRGPPSTRLFSAIYTAKQWPFIFTPWPSPPHHSIATQLHHDVLELAT